MAGGTVQSVRLATQLIVRDSTGPPAAMEVLPA
jgi:hypothetical protein